MQCIQTFRLSRNWISALSVLNLFVLVLLYFSILTIKKISYCDDKPLEQNHFVERIATKNISYWDDKLLEQDHFVERIANKRALTMSGRLIT